MKKFRVDYLWLNNEQVTGEEPYELCPNDVIENIDAENEIEAIELAKSNIEEFCSQNTDVEDIEKKENGLVVHFYDDTVQEYRNFVATPCDVLKF